MNHLSGVDRLANRFAIMRHGQSKANTRGIIVSRIETDRRGDYGLTDLGRQQALAAARCSGLPANTVICTSDFARARQTAQIVRAHLGAPQVLIAAALRERCFGDWEGSATDNYTRVWAADETDPGEAAGHVEPAAAVLDRSTALIVDLDRRYRGRDILLVSHGDPLQILQAGFLRMSPSRHRNLPELKTGEIRPVRLPDATSSPRSLAAGGPRDEHEISDPAPNLGERDARITGDPPRGANGELSVRVDLRDGPLCRRPR